MMIKNTAKWIGKQKKHPYFSVYNIFYFENILIMKPIQEYINRSNVWMPSVTRSGRRYGL
jgi:hypothetical protein